VNDPPSPLVHSFKGMRRILLAFTLSLAVHAALVVSAVALAAWRGFALVPPVRLAAIAIDVKELPLGGGRSTGAKSEDEGAAHPVRRPKAARARVSHASAVVALAPDGGAADASAQAGQAAPDGGREADSGRRRPGDLRNYGPEGSRLTALLRLDRLRASASKSSTVAAIDQLLVLLPDRRRLLDGTGLDLYRDFDALLIATPEPRNDKVTFLAARHHLKDAALRAALDRGAAAGGYAIAWRSEDGRPVGVRRPRAAAAGESAGFNLDDRILVLPQPFLAVMAPPAYAERLLGRPARKPAGAREATGDAGMIDGGLADAGPEAPGKRPPRITWRELVARIDAEDSALPDDAVFMITAVNLLVLPGASPVVPGTRGVVDDDVREMGPYGPTPQALTLVVGIDPAPYLELVGEFESESEARSGERKFPLWKRSLMLNPVLLLGGFAPLVDRAELSREEKTLFLRASTTAEELQRLLAVVTNLARGVVGHPR
jgi:hypothetical protein